MGSGDWSLFHDGFDKTIKKAEDLYKALDQLNNTRISYSYFSEKHDDTIENARLVATDKSKSKEERETALTTWLSAIDAKKTASETLKSDLTEQ